MIRALCLLTLALPAHAEVRTGISDHNTAILGDHGTSGREDGPVINAEISNGTLFATASVNTAGDTSFAAAGLEYTLGDKWFIRPALGLAIHDGHINGDRNELKLGSRALIYTRADLGHDFGNWSLAFRVEHLSNANLGDPNNGLDNYGVVIAWDF